MAQYLRLIRNFIKTSVAAQAGFRGDFLLGLFINAIWILAYVVVISTIFYNTNYVAGWSKAEIYIIFGIFELTDGALTTFVGRNIEAIPGLVRDGSMDYVVTKPIDSQFHLVFRRFSLNDISVCGVGLVAISYGLSQIPYQLDPLRILAGLILVACGAVLYYSISMLVHTLSFWFIRVENLPVLVDVTYVVARYPLNIFGGVMQKLVFYVIPLAFFATVPALVLLGKAPIVPWLLAGMALAPLFFMLSRAFWFQGLRAYSSASS